MWRTITKLFTDIGQYLEDYNVVDNIVTRSVSTRIRVVVQDQNNDKEDQVMYLLIAIRVGIRDCFLK